MLHVEHNIIFLSIRTTQYLIIISYSYGTAIDYPSHGGDKRIQQAGQ
jgi:hypothetical protein